MRRFLLLLTILCAVFTLKVRAQNPQLTAPKNVCLNSYASMHAFFDNNTEERMVYWSIKYPDGTVLNHRYDQQGNYPDGHHPDFRYMSGPAGQSVTFDVKQVGIYEVTISIRYRVNGNNYTSATRTKSFQVYDCTMDECEGTFTPATNFKETFGTFVTGGPRRQVLPPDSVGYRYMASGNLEDDDYSIYYNSRLGGRPEWDNVGDHTDNGNGGMLIANSSNNPKLFYQRRINGLCPGAKYNFSAWFINLNSLEVLSSVCQTEDYRYAGVTFVVRNASDSSILRQFNTNDVSMDLSRNLPGDQRLTGWQQFGGTLTLAPGEENVIVQIINNNPGGCGNDIAVDDIEFVFCAPKIYSYIDGLGVDNDMVCPGAELTITSKIEPIDYFTDPVYVWEMNKNGAGWGPVTEPGYVYVGGDTSILHISQGVLQEEDYIQYRLYVFERNNVNTKGCYTPGNMVTLSVPKLPTILASRPVICRGDTTTLTASPLEGPGITGYETFEFVGPNIVTWPTLPVPKDKVMVTPDVNSTYEVKGSILYGQYGNGQPRVCFKEASITIEVDQPPTVNIGPDQLVCTNEPVTLDAGAANTIYPILWEPTNLTTQTITVNAPAVSGTQAYRVAVTNGECVVRDTVNITAVAYPEATITNGASFCNTAIISLAAVEPDPGYSGEWTIEGDDHGASITDPTSATTAQLTNMPFDQPVTVRWTVTADGTNCSDYAELDITRESRPTSTPGPNQIQCTNVFTLAANAPPNATMQGTWSVSGAGAVTFGDIHDPTTTATITSGVGSVTLVWTMAKLNSPSACGPDSRTMTIRYVDPPTILINSTDISSCLGAGGVYRFEIPYTQTNAQVYDLQAVGPNPMPGFTNISGATFVTPLRINYPTTTPAGTYTFRMVARRTNLTTCETETFFTVRIETPSTITSVTAADPTICIGSSTTLTANGTLGSNAQWVWYSGGCGTGTSVGTGPTLTVSPTSTTTYYVRAEGSGPCANTSCASATVTVNQMPADANAGPDQTKCNITNFVLDATPANIGLGRWTLPPGVTIVSGNIANPKSTVSVPAGQSVTLIWTVRNGLCTSVPDEVVLTNLNPITNNTIEEDQLICSGDQPEELTSVGTLTGGSGTYTYQWQRSTTSAAAGFSNIGGATGATYQPPVLTQNTWYRRVVTSGACTSNSNAVQITISTAPPTVVFTPPAISVPCNPGSDYTTHFGTPQFSHPEGLSFTVSHTDVTTPATCGLTITRTWTATDICGKTATTSQTITVVDDINPTIVGEAPRDTTVSCDAVPAPVTFQVSDNCSPATDIDIDFTETRNDGGCDNTYQLVREWTITDLCGNDTIIRQLVNVVDTTHPVVVGELPRDTTVSCDAVPVPDVLVVSDNCAPAADIDIDFTETRNNSACDNTYQLVREWTITDLCGNDTIIRQLINVVDTTNPGVVGQLPRDTTVSCDAVPVPDVLVVSDNCTPSGDIDVDFTETRTDGDCPNTYQLLREWTITDLCGNDTIIRQLVNVVDTTHPVVVGELPRDTTVSCDAVPVPDVLVVSDNCAPAADIDVDFTETRTDGDCANTYQLLREWTITDLCGNDTIIRQLVNVIDTTNPGVVGPLPRDTTVSCDAVPVPDVLVVSDNCAPAADIDVDFTETRTDGGCPNTYQLLREWTITDECGNDTIIRQLVNVIDTTHPVVVGELPRDTTVSCDAVPVPDVLVISDNCAPSGDIDVDFTETRNNGACDNTYQLVREWTITDLCGNDTIIRQLINVVDTTKPGVVGDLPRDTTVSCDAVPVPDILVVSDNCAPAADINVDFTETRNDGACPNTYQLVREWTITDECGNDTIIRQLINVVDTTNPGVVGQLPRDTTVSCDAVPVPDVLVVSDNCAPSGDIDVDFTETRTDGDCPNTYQLLREWTITDLCGNDTIIRQLVNVVDTTHPVVVGELPRDTTVSCDAVPVPEVLVVSDNCAPAADIDVDFTETRTDGDCANTYQLLREWTITDLCGNDTIIRQLVNVIDTTNPGVVGPLPRDTTVSCDAVPVPDVLVVSDNCAPAADIDVDFTETRTDGGCPNTYQLLREWTITDECGNDTIIRQLVNVIDTTHPVVVGELPRDTTVSCDAVPVPDVLVVSDNCAPSGDIDVDFTETRNNGACDNTYQLVREWTITDLCGNDTIIRQLINVVDTTHPGVVGDLPRDTTVSCDAVPVPDVLVVSDNCAPAGDINVDFSETRTDGGCPNTYQLLREWTITDECGNDTIIRQLINVVDTTNPGVVGQLPRDTTVSCDAVPVPDVLVVSDNCAPSGDIDVDFTETRNNGACDNTYQLVREWTITDLCGNDTIIRQLINVVDTTHPGVVGDLPRDTTVSCDAVPVPDVLVVSDNCAPAGDINVDFTETRNDGDCPNTYQLVREWTITDECGNDTIIRQLINVVDTTNPGVVGQLPRDTTVSCDAVPVPDVLVASDNCAPAADVDIDFTETRTDGDCPNTYQLLREWTITDLCGNDTIIRQLINVVDTTNPTVTSPLPRDTTVSCDAVPLPDVLVAADNCAPAADIEIDFTETRNDGACDNTYQLVREWTITDLCGNDTTIRQLINVVDTTKPGVVGQLPRDTTVSCDAVPIPDVLVVSDNCAPAADIDVDFTETRTDGGCPNAYQLLREWTITDECGNDTIIRQLINVVDTTKPGVVGELPRDTTVSCDAVPLPLELVVSDNCAPAADIDVDFTETRNDGACDNTYQLVREWTITDLCGNDTIIRQLINVVDTTNPGVVGQLPRDTTVSCDAVPVPDILVVSDNCAPAADIDVDFTETRNDGDCLNTYQLVREWTITDECGNDTIIRQLINVVDTTNPAVVGQLPRDTIVSCDAVPVPDVLVVSDNCAPVADIDVDFTETRTDGDCANTYQLLREWTITDLCGNDTIIRQLINVVDTTRPGVVGQLPRDTTVSCDAVPVPDVLVVSDNCAPVADIDVDFTETRTDGDCANTYQLLREWTITDECGNDTIIRQLINVVDTTNPTVVSPLPRDTTVSCDAVPIPDVLVVADNCAPTDDITIAFTETRTDGDCANTYELLREWTITDLCGNDTIVRQLINVVDTTNPTVVSPLPRDTTVSCDAVPIPDVLEVADNCAPTDDITIAFTETRTDGGCPNSYQLLREWTISDLCGNDTIVRQLVNVIDTTNPGVVGPLPGDTTVSCDAVPLPLELTVSDNCAPAADIDVDFTETRNDGACDNTYQLVREWTITDLCGNDTIIRQLINVVDTTNPGVVGQLPRDTTVSCDAVPVPDILVVSDNCAPTADIDVDFTETRNDGDCPNSYQLVREWTITDECGNDTIIRQLINVVDTTNPVIVGIAPRDTTVSCDAVPVPATVEATDNCSPEAEIDIDFTETRNNGDCDNTYQLIRQWTITDACGNDTIIRQLINVVDTTRPGVVGQLPRDTTVSCDAVPLPLELVVSDNCAPANDIDVDFTETRNDGACDNSYQLVREWTITDLCGNDTIIRQLINVVDTTNPGVVGPLPRDTTVSCDAVPLPLELVVSDNCAPANDIDVDFTETRNDGACDNTYQLVREWTITDLCGNDTIIRQLINVVDTTNPTVTGPLPRDTTVSCDAVPLPVELVVADNCASVADIDIDFTETRNNGVCANTYQLVRQWTITDACGNDTIVRQLINVVDTTNPYVVGRAPADTTVSCDAVPPAATFAVGDNCADEADIDVTYSQNRINGTCDNTYQLIREWTITDACGNDTIIRQRINVVDTTRPGIVGQAPRDTTVSCDAVPVPATLVVADNCAPANDIDVDFNETRINGVCANTYQLVRQWTITDLCGNDTIIRQLINVVDTTRPMLVGLPLRDTTVSCDAVPVPQVPLVADNCTSAGDINLDFTETRNNGACANTYQLVREWTATDQCGNSTIIRQLINVVDTTNPQFVLPLPANITVECDDIPVQPDLDATDNCSSDVTVVKNETRQAIPGRCVNNYLIIRTWTAIDDCNNTLTHTQTITVIDTTAPVFATIPPANITVACDAVPAQPDIDATDNCSISTAVTVIKSQLRIDGSCANSYQLVRTWTATDECGNTRIITQTVNVEDRVAPVFTTRPAADTLVSCDAVPPQQVLTATDNCSAAANVVIVPTETRIDGACANSYQLIRTWTATDECNNSTQWTQTVTVEDRARPVFFTPTPRDTTVNCDAIPAPPVMMAKDNCTDTVNVNIAYTEEHIDITGACANNYRLLRRWVATDECGNATTVIQVIDVRDTTRPQFVALAPADTTVNCHMIPTQPDIDVTDNCSVRANVTVTKAERRENIPGACVNNYRLIRTWTATDECNNIAVLTQVITVQDTTAPVFAMPTPANITVECNAIPTQPMLTATDNCSTGAGVTVTRAERMEQIPGSICMSNYRLIRTWTATDQCGNQATVTQTITVIDTTAPTFTMSTPADVTVECNAIPTQPNLTATDNCTPSNNITIVRNERREDIPGACVNNYRLIRTWTATDLCGNETTVQQVITVRDITAPTFTQSVPADATVQCSAIPVMPNLQVTDNCTPSNIVTVVKNERREDIPGACVNNYRLIRTWTATDECGNTRTVQQVLTVVDNIPPVFTIATPSNATVECNAIPVMTDLAARDNCSTNPVAIVKSERREDIPGACVNNYRLIRSWRATDECGNSATVIQVLTVVDRTAPAFTMPTPADITVECDAIPTQPDLTATDNCSFVNNISILKNETRENIPGACVNNYRLIRTWTATDECDNSTTVTQVVTVTDRTAPVFTMMPPANLTVNCHEVPAAPVLTATDNCSANNVTVAYTFRKQLLSATCINNYRLTRTWTATDECGNKAIATQIVTVIDTTRPVFNAPAPSDMTVSCDAIPAPVIVTASDNCSRPGAVKVTHEQVKETIPGACTGNYRLINIYTAKDECGNTSVLRQVITVVDTTSPVIATPPADITVACGTPVPTGDIQLMATDNCDASFPRFVSYTTDPYVRDVCSGYTITRRWSVTDGCGNAAQEVTQRIIVLPCPKPELEADVVVNCSSNPFITLKTSGNVNRPVYTLVGVTPANAVQVPVISSNPRFNVNGATTASFIVRDGITGCASDTMTYDITYLQMPVVNLGSDTSLCGGNGMVLDAGAANFGYQIQWSTGETTQRIRVTQAGTYRVTVSNGMCTATDEINVGVIPMPLVNLPDTTICRGQNVILDASVPGASYLWSTGATTPSINVSTHEQFWVRVAKNGCITIDTINVTVNPPPDISLSRDTSICPGQSVLLTVNTNAGRIQWGTGEIGNSILVSKAGNYSVAVYRDNCVVRETVRVSQRPDMEFDLGPDRIICPGGSILVDARHPDASTYRWNDGDLNPVKSFSQSGKYILGVLDRYCDRYKQDSFNVIVAGPPTVNLGNDTIICKGRRFTLRANAENATSYLWSNGQTTSGIEIIEPGTYSVTAFNDCGSTTDEITIDVKECDSRPDFPNAFSPNGDGNNDVFRPVIRGPMYDYELRIFNRWGELVFLSKDMEKGWNGWYKGRPVDIGTFVWWLTYKKVTNGPSFIIKGDVTVIR